MAYIKQNFKDGDVLKAEHLNHMEEGIANAGEPGKDAVIDATLTQEGEAADAKATGKAISQLKSDKVDKPSVADNNKILRANGGEVEWVEVGQPTDEQTNSAVANWLNDHPEATTTVQDGSITEIKIDESPLNRINQSYNPTLINIKSDVNVGQTPFWMAIHMMCVDIRLRLKKQLATIFRSETVKLYCHLNIDLPMFMVHLY